MSSCVLSSRTNINKTSQEEIINEPEDLLNQGIENIYHSFNMNNKIYKDKINENENIINGLTKKLEMLNNEMEMLQRENHYYKTQNEKLKKEVEKLNKIVKNIQGRLSSVDYQIKECIKGDNIKCLNIKKNYESNKKMKNSSLLINFKNKDNNQSLFQLNSKNYLITENEKNGDYNNKSTKNKRLVYYIDNTILKDNGNKINYDKDINKENNKKMDNDTYNNIKKKFNKTVGYNSFDLNMNINNNLHKKNAKLRTPNSVLYKNVIKDDKKKRNNNREMESDLQPRDTSLSCQDNNKNRSYSSKQFIKEKEKNIISNNKTTDEIEINNALYNEDIDNKVSNNKEFEGKICLTYDNKLSQMQKKKNSYNSFRRKILNKNISDNDFINEINKRDKYSNIFGEKKKKNDEITFFLRKCKMLLDKESFEEIMKLFQDYKDGLLTDEGIITKTQTYLENNEKLIELFNKVFSK